MASLNGQTIASSYEQLLHVDRDGGGNSTTLVDVKDGDNGTTFALKLATDKIQVNGSSDLDGAVTINESSADADFRVESNGNTHMLFVDAGNNRVGIGTSGPAVTTQIHSDDETLLYITTDADNRDTGIWMGHDIDGTAAYTGIVYDRSDFKLKLFNANSIADHLVISNDGFIGISTSSFESWHSNWDGVLQISATTTLGNYNNTDTYLLENAYHDGSWKYQTASHASKLTNQGGSYVFSVADSGSADATITWRDAFTINNNGDSIFSGDYKAGFGAGTPGAQVEIREDDTSAAANSYHEILRINNQTGNAADRTAMIGFSSYNTGGNTAYCGARTEGTGAQTAFEIGVHSGATLEERFRIASDSHTTVNITSTATGSNQPSQKIQFRGYHANTGDGKRTFAKIQGQKHNNTGGAVGGDLLFFTNNTSNSLTERLKIDENGLVQINQNNTGSAGSTLKQISLGDSNSTLVDFTNVATMTGAVVSNSHNDQNTGCAVVFTHRTGSSGISYICSRNEGSDASSLHFGTRGTAGVREEFRIDKNGNLTANDTSIGTLSDERLKTNIQDYDGGLDLIKQLRPRTFEWKENTKGGSGTKRGLIAQEVASVDNYWIDEIDAEPNLPDFEYVEDTGMIYTSKLGAKDAMYISAIKSLVSKIDALEARIESLEA